jgi:hypothetical protein
MFEVMMKCPYSLQEGPIGIEVEGPDTWQAITFVRFLYLCASCGQTHLVDKRYARLRPRGTVLAFKRPLARVDPSDAPDVCGPPD